MKRFLFLIFLILFVGINLAAETRFKVGYKRWAFHINTSDGKHQREEFVDDNGVSFGKFKFFDKEGKMKEFQYKMDSTKEPDFIFNTNIQNEDKEMFNYSSITDDKEFAGHVIFKIGNSLYDFNFMTGDKLQNREEALNSDGLLYGKFVYLDDKEQYKVVRYRFNMTGENPEFEVSMDNRAREKQKFYKPPFSNTPSNPNPYDNRLTRRILTPTSNYRSDGSVPTSNYRSDVRVPPMSSYRPMNMPSPSHNVIVPNNGNWYYSIQ